MVIKLDFNSVTGRFNLNIFLAGGVSPWRPVRLEALSWRAVLLEAFSWRVVRLEAPEKFDNWRNVLLEKCPPWRRVRLEACPPGGMFAWRRVLLEACPLERCLPTVGAIVKILKMNFDQDWCFNLSYQLDPRVVFAMFIRLVFDCSCSLER